MKENLIYSLLGILVCISSCEMETKLKGSLFLKKTEALPEEEIMVEVRPANKNGGSLTYNWSVDGGKLRLNEGQDTVWWTVPQLAGNYLISVIVSDNGNDLLLSESLTVQPVEFYDQYNTVQSNVGQSNLYADIVDGKVFMQVDFGSKLEYGSLVTLLDGEEVEFNTVDLRCGFEMFDNGYVTYVFYFKVDENYVGGQIDAIQFEIDPISPSYNWTIKYKWKDYSTGNYYWEWLEETAGDLSLVIGADNYNKMFHDIRFIRDANNNLSFYYDGQLVHISTGIADLIANDGLKFTPALSRFRYYVYYDAYMEVDYIYIY